MNRRYWMKQSKQENLIYLAVWGLLFAAPLLSRFVGAMIQLRNSDWLPCGLHSLE